MLQNHKIRIEIITISNPRVFIFSGEEHYLYILSLEDANKRG